MRIKGEVIDEFTMNKSQFITYLKRVESEDEAKDYILSIKKLHPKATHHCQAFIIDEMTQRSNDDGEPSGTAGIPMLEVLRKRNLELIVAVVVRYFGGVLLGAGGLIRAYSRGVNDALNAADLYEVKIMEKFSVYTDYQYADQISYLLKDYTILDTVYDMQVRFDFINDDNSLNKTIMEITRGSATIEEFEPLEIEVKVSGDSDE